MSGCFGMSLEDMYHEAELDKYLDDETRCMSCGRDRELYNGLCWECSPNICECGAECEGDKCKDCEAYEREQVINNDE